MAAAQGVLTKLCIDTNTALNTINTRFDFMRSTMARRGSLLNGNGLRGTREEDISRIRSNLYRVGGSISFEPNAAELALLLPWILGGTPVGTAYPLDDALTTRAIAALVGVRTLLWLGCGVDRATFRASQGEPLSLDLDIVGQTESIGTNTNAYPAATIDTATGPFIFTDLVFVLSSTTYQAKDFELTIDNSLDKERFFNSPTLVSVVPTQRSISLRATMPYGDAVALYNAGEAGVAVTATFTNGACSILFTMPAVAFPTLGPSIPGRSELMISIEGNAYHSSSTNSLVVTLDSTP